MAATAEADAGPVSVDPNWKRISAGLDAVESNKDSLTSLAEQIRTETYSSRHLRSLNQLRVVTTSQFSDLHSRFMRLKPSQLDRYRSLATRYSELSASVSALIARCTALIKQSAPVVDEPKRPRRRKESGDATPALSDTKSPPAAVGDSKSPALKPAAGGAGPSGAATASVGTSGSGSGSGTGSGTGSGGRISPHTSPALKARASPLRGALSIGLPAPPPHFSLSGASLAAATHSNNPIAAAAASSPYQIQAEEQQHLLSAHFGDTNNSGSGDVSPTTSQAMAQLSGPIPWSESERAADEARTALAQQQQLASDVAQVAEMVSEVRQMFGELKELVGEHQQPMIDTIDKHVTEAKANAENGLAQISTAAKYKSFGMALGGGLLGLVVGGPIGFVAGAKTAVGIGLWSVGGALIGSGAGRLVGTTLRSDAKSADSYLADKKDAAAAAEGKRDVPLTNFASAASGGSATAGSAPPTPSADSAGSGAASGFVVVPSPLASTVHVSSNTPLQQSFVHIPTQPIAGAALAHPITGSTASLTLSNSSNSTLSSSILSTHSTGSNKSQSKRSN